MASKDEALPTQQFIDVEAIEGGVLILKGGSLRQIVAVSGINFDLKSEDEQNAITFGYQNFLNSLNFTVQFFVHSRKINVERYLENLKNIETAETNPLLKTQVGEYREFIRSFVAENAIMHKSFYVIVPFDVVDIPGASGGGPLSFLKRKKAGPAAELEKTSTKETLERNMSQLSQRVEQIVGGLQQLGLTAVPMSDQEVTELLYNLYNPETAEKKGLEIGADRNGQITSKSA